MTMTRHDVEVDVVDGGWVAITEATAAGRHEVCRIAFREALDATTSPLASRVVASSTPTGATMTLIITNTTDSPIRTPRLSLTFDHSNRVTAWFGGSFSYAVYRCCHRDGLVLLLPSSGDYRSEGGSRYRATRKAGAMIAPGGEAWVTWTAYFCDTLDEVTARLIPDWMPVDTVVEAGSDISVELVDGAVSSSTVSIRQEYPRTVLSGDVGTHDVTFSDHAGEHSLELGWAESTFRLLLDTIEAEEFAQESVDVRAWLLASLATWWDDEDLLDQLDVAVASALETPTPFGVAAAAVASAKLGRTLLSDACAALEHVTSWDSDRGWYLAASVAYVQALAQDYHDHDDLFFAALTKAPGRNLEGRLLSDPDEADACARWLMHRLGDGLPGPAAPYDGYSIVLLKKAASGRLSGELLPAASRVYRTSEAWFRCYEPRPSELAWFLF